jgi:hypothetical protein
MSDLIDTNKVRKTLVEHCINHQTITYKELANQLGIEPPHSIGQVVALLESCQEDDATLRQPQLAAVVIQKTGQNYPRAGFFQKLSELGLYSGPYQGPEAQMWHQNELEKVFSFYG